MIKLFKFLIMAFMRETPVTTLPSPIIPELIMCPSETSKAVSFGRNICSAEENSKTDNKGKVVIVTQLRVKHGS